MTRHALRPGEYLAIDPGEVQRDEAGFFFLLGPDARENEHVGTVCIVSIRGALSQCKGDGGDSYEAIVERVQCAIDYDPKPTAILLRIDSRGGVVAGLNEAVRKLQKMSASSGIPFVAYVDEIAASAAYAMCCACEEILAPPSAIIGSIGTISTMVSQSEADKKAGIDVRLITSGSRKADGHLHAPITDAAVNAEAKRNAELASQFFALASKARGKTPSELQSLQAAIYLAKDARRVGLIDDVISFDDLLLGLDKTSAGGPSKVAPSEGNITDRRAREVVPGKTTETSGTALDTTGTRKSLLTQPGTSGSREPLMAVKLDALIKKTEAAIAAETDPRKLAGLKAKLLAFTSTRAEMDDDEDDKKSDDEEDDEEEESKAKKAAKKAEEAKKAAEAAKHRAKAAEYKKKAEEAEEAAKYAEGSEEEEEEAAAGGASHAELSPGAAAALAGSTDIARQALARVEALEKEASARAHAALIDEALAQRRITRPEAKKLRGKPLAFVRDFLDMRPNAIVATTEEALEVPNVGPAADIGPEAMKQIDRALSTLPPNMDRDKIREAMIEDHRRARANGASERY